MQGPAAACILGELGADVIKVESRVTGDPLLGLSGAFYEGKRNAPYEVVNRNKRGIVLDLKKQESRNIINGLVKRSDVFIHSFRSEPAARLGLDYASLSALNPRLIYGQASTWGPVGPDREKPGFDAAAMAKAGLMYTFTMGTEKPLEPPAIGFSDMSGAVFLALGILAALNARNRTGKGQRLDTSIFGSSIAMARFAVSYALSNGVDPSNDPANQWMQNPLYYFYECADGRWIYLVMNQYDRYWPAFCDAAGVDEKLRLQDLANDAQAMANEYIMDFDNPRYGREKVVGIPWRFSDTKASVSRPCPVLGEHTEEVLLELGYNWDDIARLKEREVI
jgi:crotonobetainyl-CoA:carnitine CoA-transferase CaiB-like acyl-CoA transferase